MGPHCRNCHKGSTACNTCHGTLVNAVTGNPGNRGYSSNETSQTTLGDKKTAYKVSFTSTGETNTAWAGGEESGTAAFYKVSRTADWDKNWREATSTVTMGQTAPDNAGAGVGAATACGDDGFSWPHRTLGWKMLKDDLFGLDITGSTVANVGETRSIAGNIYTVHDIDSVCLDCHNPTVWNASSPSHTDTAGSTDDYDDELLLRGLP